MKRKLIVLLALLLCFTSVFQLVASAEGMYYRFQSTADPEPLVLKPFSSNQSPTYKVTKNSTKKLSKKFVNYLTGSWAQAASYTWSKSNSASWSYAASLTADLANNAKATLGITGSRTTTYSVAITIPADSKKFSKLSFCSDYTQYNVTVSKTEYVSNPKGTTTTVTGTIDEPLVDTYLVVSYQ